MTQKIKTSTNPKVSPERSSFMMIVNRTTLGGKVTTPTLRLLIADLTRAVPFASGLALLEVISEVGALRQRHERQLHAQNA